MDITIRFPKSKAKGGTSIPALSGAYFAIIQA